MLLGFESVAGDRLKGDTNCRQLPHRGARGKLDGLDVFVQSLKRRCRALRVELVPECPLRPPGL